MEPQANRIIKGYELGECVGSGGFGAVYRAYQPAVHREVAIKVILMQYANEPDFIRRFDVEAQLIARLEHPHIVPLYDYWRDPDGAYLVMRWLPNQVRAALQHGPWSTLKAARLLDQVAAALTVAHREGIIHRDIKPDNILLDEDDNAYLADFGIAKDLNLQDVVTNEGTVVGSPAYLTPEQIRGEPVTARSDIYSLGLVIYELLVGRKPYEAATMMELFNKHLNDPLPPLAAHQPELPATLNEVLQTATAKDPTQRYPTPARFAAAFQSALPNLSRAPMQPLPEPLTSRELEILRLMVEGLTNPQIAQKLTLTAGTVKWYINQIYSKLDVHSRQQAVARAKEFNLHRLKAVSGQLTTIVDAQAISTTTTARAMVPPELVNPYKGLRAFQEADAANFFGRASLTEKLLARLNEPTEDRQFIVLVGPSGSGKSSVARAGLIPALRKGALPNSAQWFITDMLPGTHPFEELEAALLRVSASSLPNLVGELTTDRRGLVRAAKRILPTDSGVELLLVIDQFEELFTLVSDEAVRAQFIDNLLSAVTDPRSRIRILVTLRADFYDRPLLYSRFAELVSSHTEVIVPLSANELERAITGPAERIGLTLEPGLVTTITNEVGEQPGALPLLQYALTELFERREDRKLTLNAYRESGGVSGALARRADELFSQLNEGQQVLVRQIFLRLVTLGEGTEDTRRRVLQNELASLTQDNREIEELLALFNQYRLLTLDRDLLSHQPTVEVAHEALIRTWGQLRVWLTESRDDLQLHRRLVQSVVEWQESRQDTSFLATGTRLTQFELLTKSPNLRLNQGELAYIQASLDEYNARQQREQIRKEREARLERRSINFLRGLVIVSIAAAIIGLFLTAIAVNQTNASQNNLTLSISRELAYAAVNNLSVDPGLSLLLADRAVRTTYDVNGTWTREAEEALHRAVAAPQALRVLQGHTGGLYQVVYSPDQTRLASASSDGTAKIWDVVTGKELKSFRPQDVLDNSAGEATSVSGAGYEVYAVAFSPDSTLLATGSRNGKATVWDVATGKALVTFQARNSELSMTSVAFSPDGTQLATVAAKLFVNAGLTWEVNTWNVATHQNVFTVSSGSTPENTGDIVSLSETWGDTAFSPDGTLLAIATSNNVYLWNIAQQKIVLTLTGHTSVITRLAFSPDGTRVAAVSLDSTAKLWEIKTPLELGAVIATPSLTLQGSFSVAFSPNGKRLVAASPSGTAEVWDANSGLLAFSLIGHSGAVRGVAFSPDGLQIATAATDKTIRLWVATPGGENFTISAPVTYSSAAYSPNGARLAATIGNRVQILDALDGKLLFEFTIPPNPDGKGTNIPGWVQYSPDGKHLVTSGVDMAQVWDASTGKLQVQLAGHTGGPHEIRYSPDGTQIATGGADKIVRLWDAATGQTLVELAGHTEGIHCLGFSPDGKFLASGGDDRTVIVWDLTTDKAAFILPYQGGVVRSVLFSPDGKRLAVSSQSDTAEIWDLVTHQKIMEFGGHPGAISTVEFSPDGKFIATSGGTIVKLWNADTGADFLTLYGNTGDIIHIEISPDSQHLITWGYDHTLRGYILSMERLIPLAESRIHRTYTLDECQRYLHLATCPGNQ